MKRNRWSQKKKKKEKKYITKTKFLKRKKKGRLWPLSV